MSIIRLSRRQGFSLTEGVVVIGVVGIIVGALFAMVTPTQTQTKSNQSMDQLGVIVNNVRSYYSGRALPSGLSSCASTAMFTSINPYRMPPFGSIGWSADQYKNTAIFPPEMVHIGSGGMAMVNNPLSSSAGVSSAAVDFCGSNPVLFAIRYSGLTQQNCTSLVMHTSELTSGMNLFQIKVNNYPVTVNNTISLSTATAACISGGSVDWYFKLGG